MTLAATDQHVTDTRLTRVLRMLGVDRAIGWTAAARVWSVFAAPISLLLIASKLTPDEQGFYYTFASIVALQVFFELGLGYVVQQFASHEKAFLTWQTDGTIGGSESEKARLARLLRTALKWYAVAACLGLTALLVGGTIFFALKSAHVSSWQAPWVTLSIAAACSLFLIPLFAVLEGCGAVAEVARVRTFQTVAGNLAAWTTLLLGGRLWTAGISYTVALLIGVVWLVAVQRHFLRDLLSVRGGVISWRNEVWPFQWRIAISWVSGYLVFQLFTPVLFAFQSPALAGRMGMSFTVVSAMSTVAMSWLTTKVPFFGERVARRDFDTLDRVFFPSALRSLVVFAAGGACFFTAVVVMRHMGHPWATRVLDPLPLALLIATMLANHVVFVEATYLRAHKQEPFLALSVTNAVAVSISTVAFGKYRGPTSMMAGFCVITLFVASYGTAIFIRKRRLWHA